MNKAVARLACHFRRMKLQAIRHGLIGSNHTVLFVQYHDEVRDCVKRGFPFLFGTKDFNSARLCSVISIPSL